MQTIAAFPASQLQVAVGLQREDVFLLFKCQKKNQNGKNENDWEMISLCLSSPRESTEFFQGQGGSPGSATQYMLKQDTSCVKTKGAGAGYAVRRKCLLEHLWGRLSTDGAETMMITERIGDTSLLSVGS